MQTSNDVLIKAPRSLIHGDEMILLNKTFILQSLKGKDRLAIIEIGSQRGTGSTHRLCRFASQNNMHFITVDADENNAKGAAEIIAAVDNHFEAHHQLGEIFLRNYSKKNIGICYLDAFDLITDWPHKESTIESYKKRNAEFTNEAAYKMHLDAAQEVWDKVVPGGFICFDDAWKDNQGNWQGKGKTAIPFLLSHGYVINYYKKNSVLLQRAEKNTAPFNLILELKFLKRKLATFIK
ncbi:MAG: hypothetical protein N2167_06330 [Flavobacteriales bacterium]|nr:hypothetical protein [Flavobacteriales bacterium]